MTTLVFATRNPGKLAELTDLVAPLGLTVRSAHELGVPAIAEEGETFAENAAHKARETARFTGLPALADDSGLEVTALGGEPGVHSARYAGPGASDQDNNAKLLEMLRGVPPSERTARFVCVVAFVDPARAAEAHLERGTCEGRILESPRGEGGFGYDPLFFVESQQQTFAELDKALKNDLSHRGRAVRQMLRHLGTHFG
jgi:XTP/dITP diphosphohydrolase